MEIGPYFCLMAAAVCVYAALQKLKEGHTVGCSVVLFGVFGALGTFGLSVYSVSPSFCGLALLCCSLCLKFVCFCSKEDFLTTDGKAVLITGCDTGIGHYLAKTLSGMGVKVFAGVLDINGVGAQQLRDRKCNNLQVLQLGVTDDSQIEQAHRYIRDQVGEAGLWGLVNNAGILHCPMDAEIQPIRSFNFCLEVNFLGAVKMYHAFLPLLRKSRGRIVNVTSLMGEIPMFTFSAYGASKAALGFFSKATRLELIKWGVKVTIVQPLFFKTSIFGNSERTRLYKEEVLRSISSEVREDYGEEYISSLCSCALKIPQQFPKNLRPVVDDICHALLSAEPKLLYTPGHLTWPGWLIPLIHHICPTSVSDGFVKQFRYADYKPAGMSSRR
ncbi:hypothetical protein LDENG_00232600 [Lucifuga dentata]|nr:hypothetical protein LDENG_00232600 [Lucifuga dentata]